jgi:hypothetical protein
MLNSAKSLAADTNSAILNWKDARTVPLVLNAEYVELITGINNHAEALVKKFVVAHQQALNAGLKMPSRR